MNLPKSRNYKQGHIRSLTAAMKDAILAQLDDQDKPIWDKKLQIGSFFVIRSMDNERAICTNIGFWNMRLTLEILDLSESGVPPSILRRMRAR